MTELTPETLRQTLETTRRQLEATPGLTREMIAQMLAPLQTQLAALEQARPAGLVFDQHEQTIERQTNAGRDAVDIDGDANIIGSYNVVQFYKVYQTAPGKPRLTETEVRHIAQEYLTWVRNNYRGARLYGAAHTPQSGQGKPRRELRDIFVPLTLARFRPPQEEDLRELAGPRVTHDALTRAWMRYRVQPESTGELVPLADVLHVAPRLAVIGGAGCGKSTLLAYLAVTLAEAARYDPPYPLPFTLPEPARLPIPLLIPLRYYRNYLTWCDASPQECLHNPRARTLTGFIPWYLQRRNATLGLSADFFDRLLQGGGGLLLLDGLDEVVDLRERGEVRHEVENLLDAVYPGTHCIVTAREAGYKDQAIFDDDFTRLDVRPLEKPQITTLVRNWCTQLYPADVEGQTASIVDEIEKVNALRLREDLPPLVDTPLLTTMVISVKWDKTELPRERARLYAACVEVILQALYVLPEGGRDTARQEVVEWGGPWDQQREWLAQLALAMHTGGADGAAVHKIRLQKLLAQWMEPADLDKFITATRERGGLLDERNDFFQFLHLTFQEFLTAWLLTKQRAAGWQTLESHLTDPWWREVALLAYGCARMDYGPIARDYLEWLTTREGAARLPGLELAGAALLEVERPEPEVRQAIARRLVAGMTDPQALSPAVVRALAGRTLAALGDPRKAVTTLAGMEFCYVPPGRFWMGGNAYDEEKPAGWCNVLNERPYWLARFPVTVAQWREYLNLSERKPRDEDSLRGADNHPVVWVYWDEARDFADWLDTYAHEQGWLAEPWRVCLPSEAEWEKAARGGEEIPAFQQWHIRALREGLGEEQLPLIRNSQPKREYPWARGADVSASADPERANYEDTHIGGTSAVGCFPGGASPYGCEDMAGNVWEWTRSLWGKDWQKPDFGYPYQERLEERENLKAGNEWLRVVRGGSYFNDQHAVRCACRVGYYLFDLYSWSGGFRVGVSLRA